MGASSSGVVVASEDRGVLRLSLEPRVGRRSFVTPAALHGNWKASR